ncbi:MAG TPA: hypothetical protein VGM05_14990, partial [Planctomycetaceae bacterium]
KSRSGRHATSAILARYTIPAVPNPNPDAAGSAPGKYRAERYWDCPFPTREFFVNRSGGEGLSLSKE